MSKSLILGNGTILIGLDKRGAVSDFYYPFVGTENHVKSPLSHELGVWDNGYYSSPTQSPEWEKTISLVPHTLVEHTVFANHKTGLTIAMNSCVYNEKNIFVRKATLTNTTSGKKEIRFFFHQVFGIYGTLGEDTAYYDPNQKALFHYEGRRVFLVYGECSDIPFQDYTVGLHMTEGKESTLKDAEDGVLSKNGIEYGQVDSTLGIHLTLLPHESKDIWYWVTVGESKEEALELHAYVEYKSAKHILETTSQYWSAWVKRNDHLFADLSPRAQDLFEKSLLYIRANIDNRGSIIASPDSGILEHGRDTYSYMWPRDGAMTALALLEAQEYTACRRFLRFCSDVLEKDGYLLHKYRADQSPGSSWEPYVRDGKTILPIQEDETALVLITWEAYYEKTRELEFIETNYTGFIKRMGMFLVEYTNKDTGLPLPSYDLWEEKYGVHTFTCATVYGGLMSAAKLAEILGKEEDGKMFRDTAEKLKASVLEHLYSPEFNTFVKMLYVREGATGIDSIVDMSSVHGIVMCGMLPSDDKRVLASIDAVEKHLRIHRGIDGIPRYQHDLYYKETDIPNPWFVTTLWLAQYYILSAKNRDDLLKAKTWIEWVEKHTPESGVMAEQLSPYSGEGLSATPLTWSHAEYVKTVCLYTKKFYEIA